MITYLDKLHKMLLNIYTIIVTVMLISSLQFPQPHKKEMKSNLLKEISSHPCSQPPDIYKFLHQAAFGSAHAVRDTAAVQNWMEREIESLNFSVEDQLVDTLSPDGRIVRVNLRPYLKNGFKTEELLDAFIKTANQFQGSEHKFRQYWKSAEKLAEQGKFKFTKEELNTFFVQQKKKNFPAVHHSEEYTKKYKPAYRVIDTKYLKLNKSNN
jgi:hypothetical protein